MKSLLVINGPNLNLLGKREPEIYGTRTLADIANSLNREFAGRVIIEWLQTNSESQIIDWLHDAGFEDNPDCQIDGVILNAGAFTHTSLAIADAIAAIPVPVVEVHLSNIFAREDIRHRSLIAPVCRGSISGFGADSYRLAISSFL